MARDCTAHQVLGVDLRPVTLSVSVQQYLITIPTDVPMQYTLESECDRGGLSENGRSSIPCPELLFFMTQQSG